MVQPMESAGWGRDLFIRLDPGDELHASLRAVVAENGEMSGAVTAGIGRIRDVEFGYLTPNAIYQRKTIAEPVELLSLQGNVAPLDGEPFSHLHLVFSDDEHQVHGGHLFSATVHITAEISVRLLPAGSGFEKELRRCHLDGSEFKPLSFE